MAEIRPEYQERRISVPQEFENVFSHFYFAENTSDCPVIKTLLPTYQTILLLFCFGGNATLTTKEKTTITVDQCITFGPIRQAFEYTLAPQTSILVANFKDDAFYRFFGKAAIEKKCIHPDDLLAENCFTALWQELKNISSTEKQVDHILEFCKMYLQNQDKTSGLLSNFKDESLNPIKIIAEQTLQSERNIQLKQKEQFGYSSKEISRYNRFLKAIKIIEKEIENGNKIEWFNIISECNYYDQSQLIHDFKHYLNISPSKYLKFQQDICNPRSD
jgi:AraC-like DNA-binding protein